MESSRKHTVGGNFGFSKRDNRLLFFNRRPLSTCPCNVAINCSSVLMRQGKGCSDWEIEMKWAGEEKALANDSAPQIDMAAQRGNSICFAHLMIEPLVLGNGG